MSSALLRLGLGAGLLLSISSPAYAYKYSGKVWKATDLPVPFYVSSQQEDSLPVDDPNYQVLATQEAFAAWATVYDSTSADPNASLNATIGNDVDGDGLIDSPATPCAGLSATYAGRCENSTWNFDLQSRITFDDPASSNAAGVLCATVQWPLGKSEVVFNKFGRTFYRVEDGDIVCNDNVDFTRDTDVLAGTCSNEYDLRAVLTHEVGHFWGLGHSCDNGDPCTDQDLREATMYWTANRCDDSQATLGTDDISGLTQLYGPSAETVCNHEEDASSADTKAFGITPWTLSCKIQTDVADQIKTADWYFGDGGKYPTDASQEPALSATHEYTTDGNFTLEVDVAGSSESCGDWTYQIRQPGYVLSCSVPDAAFSIEHENGLTYKLVNDTNVHVYGCIYDIEWDIYDSSGKLVKALKAWEPEFTFPDAGTYRVVLNVGGPAGTGAADLTFDAKNTRGAGYGCDTTGAELGDFGLILGALAAGLRSRRNRR